MIFEIADAVFAAALDGRVSSFDLLTLLRYGVDGPHRFLLDPAFDSSESHHVNLWLEQLFPVDLRDDVLFALKEGPLLDTRWEMDIEIRVEDVSAPNWPVTGEKLTSSNQVEHLPVLPISAALLMAKRPLQAVVEDWRNDGEFLRRMCPPHTKSIFTQALDQHWIHIENGGGVGNMKKRAEEIASENERLRIWMMFDSDIKQPDGTDTQTSQLENTCKRAHVRYHRLQRRAIENYLPLNALSSYTKGSASNLRGRFEAFQHMSCSQRCFFHMKGGFSKDRGDKAPRPLPEHFAEHRDNDALQKGFGDSVWRNVCSHIKDHPDNSFATLWSEADGIGDDRYDPKKEASELMLSLLRRL